LGEDITETLEVILKQWKVIQHVREKFTCRACEKISQAPAPFHVLPRGFAGPSLLAMVLFEKYGQHQPLNRQSERYAREGIDLSLSTLADQVGGCAVALRPLYALIEAHFFAPKGCMGMTPRFRSWRKARPEPAGSGSMGVMTNRLAAAHRQRLSSMLQTIERVSIPSSIWHHLPEFFRPMLTMGTIDYSFRAENRVRSLNLYAGRIRGENFSNWPILPPIRGVEKMHQLYRQSRSRPSNESTPCLTSSVRSMACHPSNG
jgi:hypothetical protein